MKTSSLQFKKAIKSNVRELDVRFIFYNEDRKYVIRGKDIQSYKYNSLCEEELGGIEKKIITLVLMKNAITRLMDKSTRLYKETWVKFNGVWYSDVQEELIVTSKNVDEAKNIIRIEAVDKLTIIREQPMPSIPQYKNINLRSYLSLVLSKLSTSYSISHDISNPMLKLAFAKSNNIHETLLEMAIAAQGIINSDLTVKRFAKSTIVDRLDYESGLLEYAIKDDDLDLYKDVVISLFSPTSRVFKSLGSLITTIPPAAKEYKIGNIEFDNLYIPQLIKLDHEISIDDYTISSSGCTLTITNKQNSLIDLHTEFFGLDVNVLKNTPDSKDNKTKFINNIYIQSPTSYDSRIYKSKRVTIKYIGNTLYEIGDTIRLDGKYDVLLTGLDLNYDGSLRGVIKGVVIDG